MHKCIIHSILDKKTKTIRVEVQDLYPWPHKEHTFLIDNENERILVMYFNNLISMPDKKTKHYGKMEHCK